MSVLYIAVPVAIALGAAALAAFAWTLRSGQLDDLETPPFRAVFDDPPTVPRSRSKGSDPKAAADGRNPSAGRPQPT
ncbi:cbb3-type cytochrome oxidase assembly protein CcoS [Planctellipticum variicoloris]|uniref:cbb3-type cytochrome oxidase assembly protein CcoS n=1 Tax=Planctellipticum variicoloris TaxID=3064265 RepID=UPI002CB41E19|nr:cbb3-type cytochrome oxidase assembly protein CcoS [Planctomycetaceae bacterium SH412]HTN01291.1 cbb3-type cytochrome oxidase assembly protein CcoS [Planctomycetaceae bacterium]